MFNSRHSIEVFCAVNSPGLVFQLEMFNSMRVYPAGCEVNSPGLDRQGAACHTVPCRLRMRWWNVYLQTLQGNKRHRLNGRVCFPPQIVYKQTLRHRYIALSVIYSSRSLCFHVAFSLGICRHSAHVGCMSRVHSVLLLPVLHAVGDIHICSLEECFP